jgi:hypothetical protein
MAEAPASVRPATTARMVAKATAEMKPRKHVAAHRLGQVHGDHVAAADQLAWRPVAAFEELTRVLIRRW